MGCFSSKVESKTTSLCDAAKVGDKETIKRLLTKDKADPNGKILTADGWKNPLVLSIEANHKEMVELLLESGADPNAVLNNEAITPLMKAVWKNEKNIALLLVKHGAEVDMADVEGDTALHYCALRSSTDCMSVLLANGAAVNARNAKLQTPLHQACHAGCLRTVRLLQLSGADVDAVDKFGLTPAAMAEVKGHTLVVQYLRPLLLEA
jgi:hypothetical protein